MSNQAVTLEEKEEAFELIEQLHAVHFNNEIFIEHLHEMFVAFALDGEPVQKDAVTNTYLNLRKFLRESENLIKK